MRIFTSKQNVHRIIAIGTLFGSILNVAQPVAAAPLHAASSAPVADSRVQRPLVMAPDAPPTATVATVPAVPTGAGPLLVNFDASASTSGIVGSPTVTYSWSFGDGLTSTLAQITHIFPVTGTYNVVLTVTNSAGQSATVTTPVTVTSQATLTPPYFGANIGDFVLAQPPASRLYSSGFFSGSLATCSNGIDIYTPPDDLRFVYRQMSGNGEVSGRLVELNRAADTGKVGIMVRDTLADGSKYIFIGTDGAYSSDPWAADARFTYRVQWRTATDADSDNADVSTQFDINTLPRWFKIARTSNTFVTSLSIDGITWVPVNTQTIAMPTTVLGGYAVTSIEGAPMNCAQFDNLGLVDNPPPPTLPTVVLTATPTSGAAPLIVNLDGTGSSSAGSIPGIKSYLWNFGDGVTSTESTAIHVYPISGTYVASLTVTNYDNLTATTTVNINVTEGASSGTLPEPWQSKDIISTLLDSPGKSNLATFGNNTVLATCGSGNDIATDTDRFRFDYYSLKGNGELKARLLSMDITGGAFGGKAGIMIRESIDKNAKNFTMVQNRKNSLNDSSLRYQYRETTGGDTLPITGTAGYLDGFTQPRWMKVSRTGDTFVAYTSTTGLDWTPVATQTIAMSETALIGFAVTSVDPNTLNCAVFDNVSLPNVTNKIFVYLPQLTK